MVVIVVVAGLTCYSVYNALVMPASVSLCVRCVDLITSWSGLRLRLTNSVRVGRGGGAA